MKERKMLFLLTLIFALVWAVNPAAAAKKPNIIVIFGDDIGMWNISTYHRRNTW